MIVDGTMRIGGNHIKHWFGKKIHSIGLIIQERGNKIIDKNKSLLVTNPSCKLVNPFTLIISFTVDVSDKYQIVIQGDYKNRYKESTDLIPEISEKEVFLIINQNQKEWYKKE